MRGRVWIVPLCGTGPSGTYRISGLASGSYCVRYYVNQNDLTGAVGYSDECYNNFAWDGASPVPAGSTTVAVKTDQVTSEINAELTKGGSISGRVTDSTTGKGLVATDVTVYSTSGVEISHTSSEESGRYTMTGLHAGSYVVCFTARDPGTFQSECFTDVHWSGTGNPPVVRASRVLVTSSAATTGINAALYPT